MHTRYSLRIVVSSMAALLCANVVHGQVDGGINIEANNYWNTDDAWANVANSLSSWNVSSSSEPPLTYTSDGYPLEAAGASTWLLDYPLGTYQVSYTGSGTVSFSGLGITCTESDIVTNGNTTTADLTFLNDAWTNPYVLDVNISNVNVNNPIDDLQIMAPGTQPGQIFSNTFLNKLAPFSTLRFMDWGDTNGNTVQNWSDRTTQQDIIQTGSNGVALENMIALCNQTGKNGWFNIPVGATDDYITNMADLLHQTMSSKETIYIEYSNELWNSGSSQYQTNLTNAEANPLLTGTNSTQLAGQEDAYRTMQISQIFQQEFGADDSQVKIVLAGQAAGTYFTSSGLSYLQSNFGNPSNYISDIAIAPYATINGSQNVTGLTEDQLFADLNQYLTSDVIPWIQQSAQLANQYHLPLVAYEGGQGLTSGYNSTGNQALMEEAQNDPRMGQLLTTLMNAWTAAGGGLFNYYNFVGNDSIYGFWSLLQNIDQTGSVKWDAMMRAILPLGDVNGDGVVDGSDLAIILANMGQSNMWYSEGDLNGDNIVNGDDLALFDLGLALQAQNAASAPEPSLGLAIFGGAILFGSRRFRRAA
jgi:hypothetical protein